MTNDKIVLLVLPSEQSDILRDYIEWHLDLGVDLILAEDVGSSDSTQEILESFAKSGRVQWSLLPDKNRLKYRSEEALIKLAIERHNADWIIMNDVDEFLCPQGQDLRTILQRAAADDVTAISVPCFNMTGPVFQPARRATEMLTLRIDKPTDPLAELTVSGDLPVPYMFVRHPPKTITRASAFAGYGPGMHSVATSWGNTREFPELRFLHYPIRAFDKLEAKVTAGIAFFEKNTHLEPWWSWHWRRWIRLYREGRLREDYESQFLSPAQAQELVRDGICTVDETIANWIESKMETCS
ncbi:MAG TPA: glycosyltransferase family 2 protein [Bryobacteraceae bacterium]